MAPKKIDATKEKRVLIGFRLDEEQAERLDAAVEARGVPASLNLSRAEKARWALLDWLDSAEKRRK